MRLITVLNQSSVPSAFTEFDEDDRMKPSLSYDRMVDLMEELVKFMLLLLDCADYLVDRYSERGGALKAGESAVDLSRPAQVAG